MARWRCMNPKCSNPEARPGFDFDGEAKTAKCPKCGIENTHPRFGNLLVKLTTIHYDPPSEVPGYGLGFPLCDPYRKVGDLWQKKEQASGEPGLANCQTCLEHKDFPKEWVDMDPARVPALPVGPLKED